MLSIRTTRPNLLYVILSGSVKVLISGEDGREAVLNHRSTGDYFGDLALVDKQSRVDSVMTTVLLEQAEGQEDGEMVTEKLTQQAIADMVGQWQW